MALLDFRNTAVRPVLRRLAISDPGGIRLRAAVSAALSVALGIGLMRLITVVTHHSYTMVTVAGFMAMQAAVVVKDTTIREREITAALLVLPGASAAAAAALVHHYWQAEDAVFAVAVFVGVWVRRFGHRGTAMGMIGFFAYFFGLLTKSGWDQLPMLVLAVVVGIGSAFVVRVWIMRPRPGAELHRLRGALRVASASVVAAAVRGVDKNVKDKDEGGPGHGGEEPGRVSPLLVSMDEELADLSALVEHGRSDALDLEHSLRWLSDVAMAVADWRERYDAARFVSPSERALTESVFDVQIATEQSAAALQGAGPRSGWSPELREAFDVVLRRLHTPLADKKGASAGRSGADPWSGPERLAVAASDLDGAQSVAAGTLANVVRAHRELAALELRRAGRRDSRPATTAAPDVSTEGRGKKASGPTTASHPSPPRTAAAGAGGGVGTAVRARLSRWHPATRAAIQCTLAAVVAAAVGNLISADRWYWAVLTSFMVFYGTSTRGELVSRAWRRLLGTVLGAVVALALVFLVGHHPPVQLALIVVCVFLAFYLGPFSYTWLTFFVTVLLGSLFELIGAMSLRILAWRVEETLVGAAIGVACAYLVLSTRSHPVLMERIAAYLRQLEIVVEWAMSGVLGTESATEAAPAAGAGASAALVGPAWELSAALDAVVAAAKPIESVGTLAHRGSARKWHRQLALNERAARLLMQGAIQAQEMRTAAAGAAALPYTVPEGLAGAADRVREQITDAADGFAELARASGVQRRRAGRSTGLTAAASRESNPATGRRGTAGDDVASEVMELIGTLPPSERGHSVSRPLPTAVRGLSRVSRTVPVVPAR